MSWQVALCGPDGVLSELSHAFRPGGDPCVTLREGSWFLESSRFESLPDAEAVRKAAVEVVTSLSGFARLRLASEAFLTVGSVREVRADGSRSVYVFAEAATAKVTAGIASLVVTHKDGTVEEHRPSDRAPVWLGRALADPEISRALRLRNGDNLSWTDLYRIFEILRAAVGGEETIALSKWATRSQLERFKRTANSVAASGDHARHGVEITDPPPSPMPLPEAQRLVDELLERWIEHGAA